MKSLIVIFIISLLYSCSGNNLPKYILPPDKMKAVLWDYIRADVYTQNFLTKDSGKNAAVENVKLQKKIFSYHHTTKEIFYKSLDYYKKNGDQLTLILDSLIVQKTRDKQKLYRGLNKSYE